MGLCISTGIANKDISRFELALCNNRNNIDHNPSSTTSKDSFHGTTISTIQHPTHENVGEYHGIVLLNENVAAEKKIAPFLDTYHNVPPC